MRTVIVLVGGMTLGIKTKNNIDYSILGEMEIIVIPSQSVKP